MKYLIISSQAVVSFTKFQSFFLVRHSNDEFNDSTFFALFKYNTPLNSGKIFFHVEESFFLRCWKGALKNCFPAVHTVLLHSNSRGNIEVYLLLFKGSGMNCNKRNIKICAYNER